jgi:hypothetical protein
MRRARGAERIEIAESGAGTAAGWLFGRGWAVGTAAGCCSAAERGRGSPEGQRAAEGRAAATPAGVLYAGSGAGRGCCSGRLGARSAGGRSGRGCAGAEPQDGSLDGGGRGPGQGAAGDPGRDFGRTRVGSRTDHPCFGAEPEGGNGCGGDSDARGAAAFEGGAGEGAPSACVRREEHDEDRCARGETAGRFWRRSSRDGDAAATSLTRAPRGRSYSAATQPIPAAAAVSGGKRMGHAMGRFRERPAGRAGGVSEWRSRGSTARGQGFRWTSPRCRRVRDEARSQPQLGWISAARG